MRFKDFFTNSDGRGSTTGFIQFAGFFILAGALIYAIFLDRSTAGEFYSIFAIYCGGLVATKGAVNAMQTKQQNKQQTEQRSNNG